VELSSESSIGIFDSGLGGLTVMKAIQQLLPGENLVYLGDTAHFPYGSKNPNLILEYSIQNISFLLQQNIKAIVLACHTVCSYAWDALQKRFDLPLIGVQLPTIEEVVRRSPKGKIVILGTKGTILSKRYTLLLKQRLPSVEILSIPFQILVHLLEEGYIEHSLISSIIAEHLSHLKDVEIDMVILGCTHFPLVEREIRNCFTNATHILDPGVLCAEAIKKELIQKNLLNFTTSTPLRRFFVSEDREQFHLLGGRFLGYPIEEVRVMGSPL